MNHVGRNAAPGSKVLSIHRRHEKTDAQPPEAANSLLMAAEGFRRQGAWTRAWKMVRNSPSRSLGRPSRWAAGQSQSLWWARLAYRSMTGRPARLHHAERSESGSRPRAGEAPGAIC